MTMSSSSVQLWLESLLLDQYLVTLEDAGYDSLNKCSSLTESDLDRLGITLLGHKRRILSHLPSDSPERVTRSVIVEDQIYDIPPRTPRSSTEIYQNFTEAAAEGAMKPALPPKVGKPKDTPKMETAAPAPAPAPAAVSVESAPTKRPVPAPRSSISTKKPVPRPRATKRKSSLSDCSGSAGRSDRDRSSAESSSTESPRVLDEDEEEDIPEGFNRHIARKGSIQLSGVTESETNVDRANIPDTFDKDNIYENKDRGDALHSDRSERPVSENLYSIEPPVSARPPPPKLPPPLSVDEIEFFETKASEASESKVEPRVTKNPSPVALFDDSLYFQGGPTPTEKPSEKPNVFNDNVTIPRSIDEWDQATKRKSLMAGTQPSAQMDLRPVRENSPVTLPSRPTPPRQCTPPAHDGNRVDHIPSVELGLEMYDTAINVDKNLYISDANNMGEESTPPQPDMQHEENDNRLNETLYAEAMQKSQEQLVRTQRSETYEPLWDMKTGSLPAGGMHQEPAKFDLPPPAFAPPPLPNSRPSGAHAPPAPERPGLQSKATPADGPATTRPAAALPPAAKSHPVPPGETNDNRPLPDCPATTRPAAALPPAAKSHPVPPGETNDNRPLPSVPAMLTRMAPPPPHEKRPEKTPITAAPVAPERPLIPTPDDMASANIRSPMPLPDKSSPSHSRHQAPLPPVRTEASFTPPTPPRNEQNESRAKPTGLRRENKPTHIQLAAGNRDTFTDLALHRASASKPITEPCDTAEYDSVRVPGTPETPRSKPAPPPRTDNPFKPMYDPTRQTYMLEGECRSISPSMYDDSHSDDTLSDGGDWFDAVDFQKPSIEVLKEAVKIVPAVQTKTAERRGYLYKKASQDTIRRMGGLWTKRWVTLDSDNLKYFSSKKEVITKRVIPVASMWNIEQTIRAGESHTCQFQVITVDRIYTFATDTRDDLTMWTNTLMYAIIEKKDAEFVEGGDMSSPDKEGYIKMEGVKNKRYFALKNEKLCYYNKSTDFKAGTPIAEVEMKLATVKDIGKHRLQIITPYLNKILIMESEEEFNKWKASLEEAIADGLGDDSVLNDVYENHSNRFCADCCGSGPHWASINFGITLCKHCAGIHRMLAFPMSKIRSLRMDFRVWKPSLLKMMQEIGNDNANNFWQWHLQNEDRLDSDSDMATRESFINFKYRNKRYCRLHPLNGDQEALNEALQKSVQFIDVLETMQLFFTGANILCKDKDGKTPLELAHESKQSLQEEFLYQNGAEGSGQIPVTTSQVLDHMIVGGCLAISHKGYLYKTGSNVKGDFLKRYCILERGELAYYENEKSNTAKDKIERIEMLSITVVTDPRYEFAFELSTTKHGRTYMFAAELEEDRRKWVSVLGKSIAPVPQEVAALIKDFTRAGVAYMKAGATGDWNRCWLQLKDRNLQYFVKGLLSMESVDLRKVTSMSSVTSKTESCKDVYEDGPMFTMNFHLNETLTTLYIQGEIQKDTEAWHSHIDRMSRESGNTLAEQPLHTDSVPVLVYKSINYISLHGMTSQGIYRLNGQHSKVTKLLQDFREDARHVTLRLEDYGVHEVATALKRFFRTLGEPLLTKILYPRWLNNTGIQELGIRLQWYQYLIKELPFVNYCTLKKLILHLAGVAEQEGENKMGITNIASIFGPIAMRVDKDGDGGGFSTTSQEIAVFKDLMEHHRQLFEVNDNELQKEEVMMQATNKIKRLISMKKKSPAKANEMLLPFYVVSREREMFQIKVTEEMTAGEVLESILPKTKLKPEKNYAIYECICREELERPLHSQEKVLSVTLKWGGWPEEFRKDNILCVKENYVYDNIELVFDPHLSLFSEMRFSPAEKKGFKTKYCFEFSQMKMSCKKDARATAYLYSWNIEDLTVYIGVQKKRNPPDGWGFTYLKNDDRVQGPFFGHSVCCNSKEEMYRWLAAILHGQNPIGLKHGGRSPPDGASAQDQIGYSTNDYSLEAATPDIPQSSHSSTPGSRARGFKASIMNKFQVLKR